VSRTKYAVGVLRVPGRLRERDHNRWIAYDEPAGQRARRVGLLDRPAASLASGTTISSATTSCTTARNTERAAQQTGLKIHDA
jgi:hypothetical protein